MLFICRLLSRLPLIVLHTVGSRAGWIAYLFSSVYRHHFAENWLRWQNWHGQHPELSPSGVSNQARRAAIATSGQLAMELPKTWLRPPEELRRLIVDVQGQQHIEEALQDGKGVLLLTPHIGNFELIALHIGMHYPITSLFRPARQEFLRKLMYMGRNQGRAKTSPADISGVRAMLKALKNNQIIGMLPDQTPQVGEGQWANFFGHPAWTMTLAARLSIAAGATLLALCERLPRSTGYRIQFSPPREELFGETAERVQQINNELEQVIAQLPCQYLWGYNRYKRPRGVPLPPAKIMSANTS